MVFVRNKKYLHLTRTFKTCRQVSLDFVKVGHFFSLLVTTTVTFFHVRKTNTRQVNAIIYSSIAPTPVRLPRIDQTSLASVHKFNVLCRVILIGIFNDA